MQTRTRRKLLQGAGITWVGGSAALLAACGNRDAVGADVGGEGGRPTDVDLLNGALDLEHMAVAAYSAGARQLEGDALEILRTFSGHEREHVDGLTAAIRGMGGVPNRARAEYPEVVLEKDEEVLRLAVTLEETAVAAFIDLLPRLSTGPLRATLSSIIACEAEHLSALRLRLGLEPVPDAFVTGKMERDAA